KRRSRLRSRLKSSCLRTYLCLVPAILCRFASASAVHDRVHVSEPCPVFLTISGLSGSRSGQFRQVARDTVGSSGRFRASGSSCVGFSGISDLSRFGPEIKMTSRQAKKVAWDIIERAQVEVARDHVKAAPAKSGKLHGFR